MTLWRDISLAAAAFLVACFAVIQWQNQPDYLPGAVFPIVLLGVLGSLPFLVRLQPFAVVATVMFFAIVLDEKSYPFNEWNPLTEQLGPLFFDNFSELLPVPGLRLTPFEFLSFVLGLGFAFVLGRDECANILRSDRFRVVVLLSLAIPAASVVSLLHGQVAGQSLSIAMTQVRSLPIMGLWTYIGYVACQEPRDVLTLAKVVVLGTLLKSLQGWWAYVVEFGMEMGRREFLIEHLTSEHMVIALVVIGLAWYRCRRNVFHDLAAALALGTILVPYVLNERRVSFIGVFLTIAFIPAIYWRSMRKWHVAVAAASLLCGLAFLGATWDSAGPLGIPARTVQSLLDKAPAGELDYRDVENFNHYSSIMDKPVVGQGFGARLNMAISLTDISSVYPLYDILPHNNILWLWSLGGPLMMGAFGVTIAFAVAVFLRLGRMTRDPALVLLSFVGFGMVVRWLVYAYADLGFVFFRLTALLGLVIGMALRYSHRVADRKGGVIETA